MGGSDGVKGMVAAVSISAARREILLSLAVQRGGGRCISRDEESSKNTPVDEERPTFVRSELIRQVRVSRRDSAQFSNC